MRSCASAIASSRGESSASADTTMLYRLRVPTSTNYAHDPLRAAFVCHRLMSASLRITLPAQILGKIALHLRRRFEWHRVEVLEQLGQQPQAVALDHARCLVPLLVVGEAFLRCETGQAHVHTWLLRIAPGIFRAHLAEFGDGPIKLHDIDVVMVRGLGGDLDAQLAERTALHLRNDFNAACTAVTSAATRTGSGKSEGASSV